MTGTTGPTKLFSIDVEEWFQVENLKSVVRDSDWDKMESRLQEPMDWLLDLLARHRSTCTFFVLGWVARKFPQLVRRLAEEGHEVASHGCRHELLYKLDRDALRVDLGDSKALLEDLVQQPVVGFRAPSFSITDEAVELLTEAGYEYDSSLFPTVAHDRYGRLQKEDTRGTRCYRLSTGLVEVPLSCLNTLGRSLPWAGGGYFRLIPSGLFRWGVKRILSRDGWYSFYMHPWEIDPGQPRVSGLGRVARFRHYNHLDQTRSRLEKLFREHRFSSYGAAVRSTLSESH